MRDDETGEDWTETAVLEEPKEKGRKESMMSGGDVTCLVPSLGGNG